MQPHGSRYWVAGYPKLVAQWHPTKNGDLLPDEISYGSGRRVWWKCPGGPDHEWQASPHNRICGKGAGCPFCRGLRASITNSLATLAPAAARQWHPRRNGRLDPTQVVARSSRRVWWKCPRGPDHEWSTSVVNRTAGDTGCPFCSGRRASRATCLARQAPAIARQWHPTRNGSLTPRDVTVGSKKRVWWRCSRGRGHTWQADVGSRVLRATGCPFCTGRRTRDGAPRFTRRDSLARAAASLLREWHPTRNGALTPGDLTTGSQRPVWWRCSRDRRHQWRAAVHKRVHEGHGCPFCSGKRVSPTNSLAARAPAIARQWHPRLNGTLRPTDVTFGATRRVFWQCDVDSRHVWSTPVRQRTGLGSGCPHCAREGHPRRTPRRWT